MQSVNNVISNNSAPPIMQVSDSFLKEQGGGGLGAAEVAAARPMSDKLVEVYLARNA